MSRAQIEQVLAILIEARDTGDAATIANQFAPDGVFRVSGTKLLGPLTAEHHGRAAIQTAVTHLVETWDFSALPVQSIHVDGAFAYGFRKGTVRHIPTNTRMPFELVDRIKFQDGQIVEFVEFFDTYGVERLTRTPG